MSVPSYDDLTPGIPDVIDSEHVDQLALFLDRCQADAQRPIPNSQRPTPNAQFPTPNSQAASSALGIGSLYACLRTAGGDAAVVLAVARDFSPRVRRVSDREVLLDVSGLGRLIGPPADIERQLARALLDAAVPAHVALAPTQTAARLLAGAGTVHDSAPRHNDHEDGQAACDRGGPRGRCAGACGRGPWLRLPVELLRELEVLPPAINDRDRARPYETLERWGIGTLGELA